MKVVHCAQCGWIGQETQIYIPSLCPSCNGSSIELCDTSRKYDDEELVQLWLLFGDIPIDDDDNIEEEFLGFPAGTDRFDIWHWFDERYPGGVHTLISDAQ